MNIARNEAYEVRRVFMRKVFCILMGRDRNTSLGQELALLRMHLRWLRVDPFQMAKEVAKHLRPVFYCLLWAAIDVSNYLLLLPILAALWVAVRLTSLWSQLRKLACAAPLVSEASNVELRGDARLYRAASLGAQC